MKHLTAKIWCAGFFALATPCAFAEIDMAPDPIMDGGGSGAPELGAGGVISGLILLIGAGMLVADWRRRR